MKLIIFLNFLLFLNAFQCLQTKTSQRAANLKSRRILNAAKENFNLTKEYEEYLEQFEEGKCNDIYCETRYADNETFVMDRQKRFLQRNAASIFKLNKLIFVKFKLFKFLVSGHFAHRQFYPIFWGYLKSCQNVPSSKFHNLFFYFFHDSHLTPHLHIKTPVQIFYKKFTFRQFNVTTNFMHKAKKLLVNVQCDGLIGQLNINTNHFVALD